MKTPMLLKSLAAVLAAAVLCGSVPAQTSGAAAPAALPAAVPQAEAAVVIERSGERLPFPTLQSALDSAQTYDSVILQRDIREDIDVDRQPGYYNPVMVDVRIDLAGHSLTGTLKMRGYRLTLTHSVRDESLGARRLWKPGDPMAEAAFSRLVCYGNWSDEKFVLLAGVRCDVRGVCWDEFRAKPEVWPNAEMVADPGTDGRIDSVSEGGHVGLLTMVLPDGDPRLKHGYLQLYSSQSGTTRLVKADGTELFRFNWETTQQEDRWYGVFWAPEGVRVCDARRLSAIDLPAFWKDASLWDGGTLPSADDTVTVLLPESGGTLAFDGVQARSLALYGRRSREPRDIGSRSAPLTLSGSPDCDTLLIDGLRVACDIAANPLTCKTVALSVDCDAVLSGSGTVTAAFADRGTVLTEDDTRITMTGAGGAAVLRMGRNSELCAPRLSSLASQRIVGSWGLLGGAQPPNTIRITAEGETSDPQPVSVSEGLAKTTLTFDGLGPYSLKSADFDVTVLNRLEKGLRLAEPGDYAFVSLDNSGGLRLDGVPAGERTLVFGAFSQTSPMRFDSLLRADAPVAPGASLGLRLGETTSAVSVTLDGTFEGPAYGGIELRNGTLTLAEGAVWEGDVRVPGEGRDFGGLPRLAGAGTVKGSLRLFFTPGAPRTPDAACLAFGGGKGPLVFTGALLSDDPADPTCLQAADVRNVSFGLPIVRFEGGAPEFSLAVSDGTPFAVAWRDASAPAAGREIAVSNIVPAASLGTQHYPTLNAALRAASAGETVCLLRNTFEDAVFDRTDDLVPADRPVTVNLCGYTLRGSLTACGSLTVTDSGRTESDGDPSLPPRIRYGSISCSDASAAVTVGRFGDAPDAYRVVLAGAACPPDEEAYYGYLKNPCVNGSSDGCAVIARGGTLVFGFGSQGDGRPCIWTPPESLADAEITPTAVFISKAPLAAIRWEGTGRLGCSGSFLTLSGIEMYAGTLNVGTARFSLFYGDEYRREGDALVPLTAIVIRQRSPERPVTCTVGPGAVFSPSCRYAIYEDSSDTFTPPPDSPAVPLALPTAPTPNWPTLRVTGGRFDAGIVSKSAEAGMPGFIEGGLFADTADVSALMADGYTSAAVGSGKNQVYRPAPAGTDVRLPAGVTKAAEPRILALTGPLPDTVRTLNVQLPDGEGDDYVGFFADLGLSPAQTDEGSVRTVAFVPPKLTVLAADILPAARQVTLRLRLEPQGGSTVLCPPQSGMTVLDGAPALDAPFVPLGEPNSETPVIDYSTYMAADTPREFTLTWRQYWGNFPAFFRTSLLPAVGGEEPPHKK